MKWIFSVLLPFYLPVAFSQQLNLNFVEADLTAKKIAYQNGNAEVVNEVMFLVNSANAFLKSTPQAVTQKGFVPSSGSKHD